MMSRSTLSLSRAARVFAIASVLAAAFGACSLNPQPIPPGYSDENAGDPSGHFKADASTKSGDATGTGADAGTTRIDDAASQGPAVDGSIPVPTTDAGVTDALDAGPDTATDAADDAPVDGPAE